MKMKVVVDDRTFEVEVGSLSERPVVATVDGERFEVWPEGEGVGTDLAQTAGDRTEAPVPASESRVPASPRAPSPAPAGGPGPAVKATGAMYAPIPGLIQSVSVREGDVVAPGQEVCVLEAMKMKNIIRASRAGEISKVCVTAGQHVQHHDLLVEFTD